MSLFIEIYVGSIVVASYRIVLVSENNHMYCIIQRLKVCNPIKCMIAPELMKEEIIRLSVTF